MERLFKKIDGKYFAFIECPDCGIKHLVSHKNYYAQKNAKQNLSFRCHKCGQLRAARTRRNPDLKKVTSFGYIKLYRPENPMSDKRGEIYEHRLVMSKKLGRPLKSYEHVHHRNKVRSDNRPENLELFSTQRDHVVNHAIVDLRKYIKYLENLLTENNISF